MAKTPATAAKKPTPTPRKKAAPAPKAKPAAKKAAPAPRKRAKPVPKAAPAAKPAPRTRKAKKSGPEPLVRFVKWIGEFIGRYPRFFGFLLLTLVFSAWIGASWSWVIFFAALGFLFQREIRTFAQHHPMWATVIAALLFLFIAPHWDGTWILILVAIVVLMWRLVWELIQSVWYAVTDWIRYNKFATVLIVLFVILWFLPASSYPRPFVSGVRVIEEQLKTPVNHGITAGFDWMLDTIGRGYDGAKDLVGHVVDKGKTLILEGRSAILGGKK